MQTYIDILATHILPEMVDNYITNDSNLSRFIQCVLKDNPNWKFDYAEILDLEPIPLEIIECEQVNTHIRIKFEFSYVLTLWNQNNQLARVTATASGVASGSKQMPSHWKGLKWINFNRLEILEQIEQNCIEILQLQNILEEYDDTSFL